MTSLNLIPPEKKEELRLAQLYKVIKDLIILILFITTIVAIILSLTKLLLQNYFTQVVEQTTMTTKYANIFNGDLKKFNQYVAAVDKIQKDYTPWPKFFIKFSSLVPDGIKIYSLTINDTKILITGLAQSRNQLLEFKNNLESSAMLTEVTLPIEDLLEKENINFNVKAVIKTDELKNYDD
ncbi:MAG: PilN domain-containing protein [Candidatus Buchananbacteria bacterium]